MDGKTVVELDKLFLSTPSARRATACQDCPHHFCVISIHALREEGDKNRLQEISVQVISIHALREEGDPCRFWVKKISAKISIHALREEGDTPPESEGTMQAISIHALREEGDCPQRASPPQPFDFYPRPPRGGRRRLTGAVPTMTYFYPRPPRGGRPDAPRATLMRKLFLSTPSARRATSGRSPCCIPGRYFYPRPPRGGRRALP